MIHFALLFGIALLAGIAIGYGTRGMIAREAGVSVSEITTWRARLKLALECEEQAARRHVTMLIADIEKRLAALKV